MASLLKNLEAAQAFLSGMRTLSSYADVERKQAAGLLRSIERSGWITAAQAAGFVHGLDGSVWRGETMEKFKAQVAEKTRAAADAPQSGRRPMQDFQMLGGMLTEALGEAVLRGTQPATELLEALCAHAASMTLRCPTELTQAVLITLAHWRQLRRGRSDKILYDLLQQHKGSVKKYLSLQSSMGEDYLTALPSKVEDLPERLRPPVFGEGKAADLSAEIHEILRTARMTPLRTSHAAVQLAPQKEDSQEGPGDFAAKVVAACMQGMSGLRGESAGAARPPAQLALLDGRVEDVLQVASSGAEPRHSGQTMSVEQQLGALVGEVQDEGGAMKRPARRSALVAAHGEEEAGGAQVAPPEPKPKRPRPAAEEPDVGARGRKPKAKAMAEGKAKAKAKATAKAKAKAKASAMAKAMAEAKHEAKPKAPAEARREREARREAVLALVPESTRQVYVDGCSTCRYRPMCTISCWAKRGYRLE